MFRVPLERQTRSRIFNGSSQYLYTGSVPVSAWPISISIWFRAASVHTGSMWSVADETYGVSGQGGYITAYLISDGKCRIQADSGADGGASTANTSTLYTAGVWHHYCGIIASDTSKEVYLNAGGVGTDTTSESFPAGLDGVSIGAQNVYRYQAGLTNYFNGELGEITIYDVALRSSDIAALASGQSPLSIRRERIVAYYPWFNSAPLTDFKTLRTYTNNGASLARSSFPSKRAARSRAILFGAGAGITGTLTATLESATLAATSTVAIAGTASPTLDAATLAATGTLAISGTASVTLDAAMLAATGSAGVTGTAAVTLDAATISATGALAIAGATTQTLADATAAGTGTLAIAGTLTGTLDAATLAATGVLGTITTGALDATLEAATVAATGALAIAGTAAPTLADATAAATGTVAIAGTATVTLDAATVVAAGNITISGALAQTLADAALAATGAAGAVRTGVLAVTLADATMAARMYPSSAGPIGSSGPLHRPPEARRAKQAAERRPPNRR